jgi:arylsulfatase
MTDNGHSAGEFNAGMRGRKGGPYEGGIRVPSFWRWPGKLPAGVDCEALTAHFDFLPTMLELAGAKKALGIDGRSMVPLLESAGAETGVNWEDRILFTHVGRWEVGDVENAKYRGVAVRNARFKLVNNAELYDMAADPGETNNVIAAHPEMTARLRAAYEEWWTEVLPSALENEDVRGPEVNPFKARFWAQYGKPARTNAWDWKMNPELKFERNRPRF